MLIHKNPKIFDVDLYGLAAIMAICALTWIFFVKSMDRKYQTLQQQQQQQQQQKQALQTQLARAQNVVQQQRALSIQLNQTPDVLENFGGIDQVIRELGDLCKASGMRLDQVTPGQQSHKEHYRKTLLAMKTYGSFTQLRTLLTSFTQKMRYTRVATLDVKTIKSATNTDSSQQMCQININLDIFAPN